MPTSKKKYLKSYLLQQSKIDRFQEMILSNPSKRGLYQHQITACENKRNRIEEKIAAIDDEVLQEILLQKYIFGKTLEEISIILNYSKRHTERLHHSAIEKFKL